MVGVKIHPAAAFLSVGAIIVVSVISVYKIIAYVGEVAATGVLLTPMLRDVFHGLFIVGFLISSFPSLHRFKIYFEPLAFAVVPAWLLFELYSSRMYGAASPLPIFYLPISFLLFIDFVRELKK